MERKLCFKCLKTIIHTIFAVLGEAIWIISVLSLLCIFRYLILVLLGTGTVSWLFLIGLALFWKLKNESIWAFAILSSMREGPSSVLQTVRLTKHPHKWNSLSTTAWHSWFMFVSYDLLKILFPSHLSSKILLCIIGLCHFVCNSCVFAGDYACLIEYRYCPNL